MATTETSPLLPQFQPNLSPTSPRTDRDRRTVTFNPLTTISTYNTGTSQSDSSTRPLQASPPPARHASSGPSGQPMLSALNSKLRRRNSAGSPATAPIISAAPKIGPQRTSKNTQKLKLLPDPETGDEEEIVDDGFPRDVYTQIGRIKEPTARRDAARLGKADRDRLPRVTAYCTANSYRLEGVMRYLKSRDKTRGTNPKLFDECVYSPFKYAHELKQLEQQKNQHRNGWNSGSRLQKERRYSDSVVEVEEHGKNIREDLINLEEATSNSQDQTTDPSSSSAGEQLDLDTTVHTPEVFLFDYGTVVIWGMTPSEESRFLADMSKFASAILSNEDRQVENFNFYYARDYQARIYNDFICLRDPRNHMIKLAISHALSQSVKTSLFEDLVSETIATTAPLPAQIAKTGSVNMTRKKINMQIGELFILRINIHLQGSVLDSPELMWAEPQLEPIYQAVRTYLEMDQRVGLLTERLDVIADLLAVLKDQLSHRHGEYLEWIVIVLIAAEILVAAINIIVDLYAGVE
ncbi:YagE family protein [Talaromyces proteolyticus]|uniref:YagE family protein n=1 Tax=Talaromyces proteolyticus TaxID=1131652 RepID=A0AAD4L1C1_9EURO|nr:YagE family protein [Talaromyces proteolyticus]KAH8705752.1 YagE family protein [Talaromyces proteolyticus]